MERGWVGGTASPELPWLFFAWNKMLKIFSISKFFIK